MVSFTHRGRRFDPLYDLEMTGRMPERFVHRRFGLLQGHCSTTLAECWRAVQLDPRDPQAYGCRGIAYLNEGNYRSDSRRVSARRQRCFEKAIADFTTAIRFAPEDASLYLWRGIAFRALGLLDSAIADLTETIHLEPKGPRAFVERSIVHQQKGEMDKAKADRAKADRLAMSLW